jgi:hypothetical protein
MSQGPTAGPGPAGPGEQELSEEQIRAYLAQLRQADVSEIIAQAFSMLAQGAEVKLGRGDARLLIDAVSSLTDTVGDGVDERLRSQMDQVVNQLRMAQVDAEKQLAQLREEGRLPAEEAGDVPADAGAATGDADSSPEGQAAPSQEPSERSSTPSESSRLWIPGR